MTSGRWHPPAGTTALIEPVHPEPGCESITAVVLDDDRLVVDIGASPRPRSATFDAVASFFTPDAFFRAECVAVEADLEGGQLELIVCQVDRIERRTEARIELDVMCAVMAVDERGCARSVTGRTRNVSRGGCRLLLDRPCPQGDAPLVSIELEDGSVMAEAFVIAVSKEDPDHWDYRLAFTAIDPVDRDRLGRLGSATAAA